MRGRRTISPTAAAVEFIPANYFAPLNLREVFPREAPLEVDIGCGDGAYLAALAQQNPEHNYLGIERLAGRIRSACNRIARQRLANVRVLLIEASYAVAYLLPPQSIAAFHILFPDPWPKRRHKRRRVVDHEFFESLGRALVPGGAVRIATDQHDYFEQIGESVSDIFAVEAGAAEPLSSTFERRYERFGAPIYRLVLRKVCDVR